MTNLKRLRNEIRHRPIFDVTTKRLYQGLTESVCIKINGQKQNSLRANRKKESHPLKEFWRKIRMIKFS